LAIGITKLSTDITGCLKGMEKKSLLKIEQIEIEKIIPREKNPRIHSEKQIQEIKNNIERFDFTDPVHVDEKNILLSGHGRCEAAKIVGLTHLPAIRKTGLSEIEKKAYVITHNKIGLNSEWDNQIVLDDIAEIEKHLGEIEFLGFDTAEIKDLKGITEKDIVISESQEYSSEDFSKFNHQCPKCKFEFN
jgi:ParB-like chromosome segregation protein Spo0J